MKKCGFTDAIYLSIHLKLSIEPAAWVLDSAGWGDATFTYLHGVYVDFGELLSRSDDNEFRVIVV